MPGLLAFYPFGEGRERWRAARFLYYGLSALQGKGEEVCGMALLSLEEGTPKIEVVRRRGLVEELLKDPSLEGMKGFLGLGFVSSSPNDEIVRIKEPRELVLIGDGRPYLARDRAEAFTKLGTKLSELLTRLDPLEACKALLQEVKGGYSFLALTKEQELLCARDALGVRPLEVGSMGFDLGIVASETAALDVMGAEPAGSLQPGEALVMDRFSIKRGAIPKRGRRAMCSFEYVYLARLDSMVDEMPVAMVRERIGQELALMDAQGPQADVVIGVPETALAFASSYAERRGLPMRMGFIRTGRATRTAIKPDRLERLAGVQLKLNPVRSSVEGKDVILIDDSVVRGTTLRNTVVELKRRGARRIHVRIGSPPLVEPCPFAMEVPPRDELIGRDLPEEELAKVIGADSLAFLSVEALAKSIGRPKEELCMACFGIPLEEEREQEQEGG